MHNGNKILVYFLIAEIYTFGLDPNTRLPPGETQ